MRMLLAACPSFEGPWREYVSDPLYDADLLYLHLGEFARHLVELITRGTVSEFETVFAAVERLQREGDIGVRRAITVGLLEGIQNVSGGKTDPERFVQYLKPESARKWKLLNDAWKGDVNAARSLDT